MPRAAEDTPLSDVIVDDSETDKIQYVPGTSTSGGDGKWTHASLTGEDFYYRGTLSSCSTQGCRLEFPFKGTAIAAYGVTSTMDNTSTWWQVDDGNIYVFEPSREGLDRTYHVRFYQSDALSFGDHTLIQYHRQLQFDHILEHLAQFNVRYFILFGQSLVYHRRPRLRDKSVRILSAQ
ncbi:hypothetical protein L226DRAFT_574569 [Lentinus tigrinus ALCF2SS1-7]|uniref:uncharacterized protein n=1 Tax=Lentinus tigrinus ALCF2SS1-7 TaxID=1328758 RepID=UPI001165F884|nr:hypothetical protein L226DRAFT_574569 [Lentinus tigrinus ALCF2SS1-7]